MTIDRPRLQHIAERKQKAVYQVPVCRHCGHSSSFVWDFTVAPATKTCRDVSCGVTEVVTTKQGAAA